MSFIKILVVLWELTTDLTDLTIEYSRYFYTRLSRISEETATKTSQRSPSAHHKINLMMAGELNIWHYWRSLA